MARASNQAPASFTSSKSNRLSGAGEFEPEPPDGEAFVPEAPVKLSRQSPRSRASTDFVSLPA